MSLVSLSTFLPSLTAPRILRQTVIFSNFKSESCRNLPSRISTLAAMATEKTKLATYINEDGEQAVGIVNGDTVRSLSSILPDASSVDLTSMEAVIRAWPAIKDRISDDRQSAATKLDRIKILAPIPRPAGTIMCIGKNYADHVKEVDTWLLNGGISKPDVPQHPIVFTKSSQSVIGPGESIRYPTGLSDAVDYEAELAVIIGKSGKDVSEAEAMDFVFGYTILNDVTARDLQKKHQQWFLGKSCDSFCPMGPWIIPASEIDGQNLRIKCWVDEELRQDGNTNQLIFNIPKLIAVISAAVTIQPGDIIATGTPAGVGSGFNPPRHLKIGQTVRIEIEGIGELSNSVQ